MLPLASNVHAIMPVPGGGNCDKRRVVDFVELCKCVLSRDLYPRTLRLHIWSYNMRLCGYV